MISTSRRIPRPAERPSITFAVLLALLTGVLVWRTWLPAGTAILLALLVFAILTIERGIRQRRRLLQSLEESEGRERESNEWLKTTLLGVSDGVITADADGNVTLLNSIAQTLTGWTQDDAAGKPLEKIFVVRNAETGLDVENPARMVLREGRVIRLANQTRLIAKDGRQIPIDDSAAPIRDEKGALVGVLLVFRDISDRRRAEATQQLLASVIESSDDAIITKDLNGIVTSWNRGAERIFGYSATEMVGRPIAGLAAPERVDEMPQILGRVRRGERIDHFETLRRTKAGKIIHVSVTISPVRDERGRIVGASKIARDITAQIEAQAEIVVQRERLRVTLSSIGDAVIATDAAGLISYLNPVAEQLTGWTSEGSAGKPLEEVFRIADEKSRESMENPVVTALREGPITGLANHTVLSSRDGREIAIDYGAAPIQDARNETIGVVLVFRDVIERRAAEKRLADQAAELRLSNAAISRANEDLNQFAFAASHDLQEPLRMITAYSELLVKHHGSRLNEDAATCLGFITEGTRRMRELLSDLLAYTQVRGSEEAQPLELVDLNQILAEALANCATTIRDTEAVVTSDRLPSVPGQRQHFVQLFQNLITNALKYRSERQPRIHVSVTTQSDQWIVGVADNGIGIAAEYHTRIFGVFKRLHGGSIAGTGIGLAICQRVVERHGGRIWVESEVDRGATFYFTLPAGDVTS
jgi:PAS domain S-box-containing protein